MAGSGRGMKSDEHREREREKERRGQRERFVRTRGKDGEHGSVKQRARGGFSFGLCQWPLCGGVCCLYVVWNKQVIVEGWGDELWLCLTVDCTVCVRLQSFMLYSKCARICLHTVFLFNHTYMVEPTGSGSHACTGVHTCVSIGLCAKRSSNLIAV